MNEAANKHDRTKIHIDSRDREKLCEIILGLMMAKGLKNLTMDSVARALGISKRTLYEIYDSKDEMVIDVFEHLHKRKEEHLKECIGKTSNAMEAMAVGLREHQRAMGLLNIQFFHDLDKYYVHLRPAFEESYRKGCAKLMEGFSIGVRQGVFRDDLDYRIILRLLTLQMESLKRMEENFPPDVTLAQAYRHINDGVLRTIATPRGLEILDSIERRPGFCERPRQSQSENIKNNEIE